MNVMMKNSTFTRRELIYQEFRRKVKENREMSFL